MSEAERALTSQRRKRGVVKASITRLQSKITALESSLEDPDSPARARQIAEKLRELDSDFKVQHFALIELIENEEDLQREQEVLDTHDDELARLTIAIQRILSSCSHIAPPLDENSRRLLLRKLKYLEGKLRAVAARARPGESAEVEECLLKHYEEELLGYKQELAETRKELIALAVVERDELNSLQSSLEDAVSDTLLNIRRLLQRSIESVPPPPSLEGKGVKIPKIDVPKFDGNILSWRTFWEQFVVSIHGQTTLSDAEKLVYLRNALSEGSAKHVIEGLSRTGECYKEAIESLKSRYDRPRIIHQTHVRMIVEAAPLRDGNGKELRRLHDTVQQHLRALKAMGCEPSGPFVTSVLELKLDPNTQFEWQKCSQEQTDVPHYLKLLEFLDLRARASETSMTESRREKIVHRNESPKGTSAPRRPITSYAVSANTQFPNQCVACNHEKHPLYSCSKFKSLPHAGKVALLKSNNLCLNCLKPGHFLSDCRSLHRCRVCQRPHHSLLHSETKPSPSSGSTTPTSTISSHTAAGLAEKVLMMTCRVLIESPDGGLSIEARGLLDSASSASFISERLVQSLSLNRSTCNTRISGIAGLSYPSSSQSIASFLIAPVHSPLKKINLSAIVVPRVTCELPVVPIAHEPTWDHLSNLRLADPNFGKPGRVDLLLGVDVFASVLRQGRRCGPPCSPTAFETEFGWVLAGNTTEIAGGDIVAHHVAVTNCDDLLRKFWELEDSRSDDGPLSSEEKLVARHFDESHCRTDKGAFVVPLPRKPETKPLGESRTQAVRRFVSLERSLHSRNQFEEFSSVVEEYFDLGHAEKVPQSDLEKPPNETFYLPMHAVRKDSSSTTKLRVVFDASAKSSTGVSLNDSLLVDQTVHSSLIDVLIRFRCHRIALIADVAKMYRAVHLTKADRDLHRFVWRRTQGEPLVDYRMTRVTFGVSASSFAANMSIKRNALELADQYPLAAKAVKENFYVDDGLTGASTVEEAIELQGQLQEMFEKGGFQLRKWNSSNPAVIEHLPHAIKGTSSSHTIPSPDECTTTLGVRWNSTMDHFQVIVAQLPPIGRVTKRFLVSDVAKTFDVLGWFSPSTIMVKILLQQLWEQKVDWDEEVPPSIREAWMRWRSELKLLSTKCVPRYHFVKQSPPTVMELHGFSDASESAYSGVVYFRTLDASGRSHTSLIMSKTKVAPIKRLTVPRLELCGALLVARLIHYVRSLLDIPLQNVYAWTDSTVVLSWIVGNPRRFKTFVGNRVSELVDCVPPGRWRHVSGVENPADCASRGLLPSELMEYDLWWNGPNWLLKGSEDWPKQDVVPVGGTDEEKNVCLISIVRVNEPIVPFDRFSSYTKLKMVTAYTVWVK